MSASYRLLAVDVKFQGVLYIFIFNKRKALYSRQTVVHSARRVVVVKEDENQKKGSEGLKGKIVSPSWITPFIRHCNWKFA